MYALKCNLGMQDSTQGFTLLRSEDYVVWHKYANATNCTFCRSNTGEEDALSVDRTQARKVHFLWIEHRQKMHFRSSIQTYKKVQRDGS
jgi:hypothetical protein